MRLQLLILLIFSVSSHVWGAAPSDTVKAASATPLSAREAFVRIETPALDLLTVQMREDMLSYLDADTIRQVPNAMGGLSSLTRPVNDSYLNCVITPVSEISFKVLSDGKKRIVAVAYTIGGDGQAADTQLAFYNDKLKTLPTKRFFKPADISDFIVVTPDSKEARQLKTELAELIPYPTIEYTFSSSENGMTARLTSGDYLGAEAMQRLTPYLRPEIRYAWNGHKFVEIK